MSSEEPGKKVVFSWNGKKMSAASGSNLLQAVLDNGGDLVGEGWVVGLDIGHC